MTKSKHLAYTASVYFYFFYFFKNTFDLNHIFIMANRSSDNVNYRFHIEIYIFPNKITATKYRFHKKTLQCVCRSPMLSLPLSDTRTTNQRQCSCHAYLLLEGTGCSVSCTWSCKETKDQISNPAISGQSTLP